MHERLGSVGIILIAWILIWPCFVNARVSVGFVGLDFGRACNLA